MKKTIIVILVLVIVFLGIYSFTRKTATPISEENKEMKNVEMLSLNSDVKIKTEDVSYFENAKGYYAMPEAPGNYPGVVMIHENRGLRPEIKKMAEELARDGYMVLAVDLFEGRVVDEQAQAREITSKFDQNKGVGNMKAALQYLKDKGATKVASLGWCFGGRQSIELSISGESLDATVVYYGGNMATTTERLKPIKWPVLGIFGDKDQVISTTTVATFKQSLDTLNIPNEIHIYPGVGHAFANPSGMNYAPNETKDAWKKTLDFLGKNLKS